MNADKKLYYKILSAVISGYRPGKRCDRARAFGVRRRGPTQSGRPRRFGSNTDVSPAPPEGVVGLRRK
jgi:hypothetical protein